MSRSLELALSLFCFLCLPQSCRTAGMLAAGAAGCPPQAQLPARYSIMQDLWWSLMDVSIVDGGSAGVVGAVAWNPFSSAAETRLFNSDTRLWAIGRSHYLSADTDIFDCRGLLLAHLRPLGWTWLGGPMACEFYAAPRGELVGWTKMVDLGSGVMLLTVEDLEGNVIARLIQSAVGTVVSTDIKILRPGGAESLIDPRFLILFSTLRFGASLHMLKGPSLLVGAGFVICSLLYAAARALRRCCPTASTADDAVVVFHGTPYAPGRLMASVSGDALEAFDASTSTTMFASELTTDSAHSKQGFFDDEWWSNRPAASPLAYASSRPRDEDGYRQQQRGGRDLERVLGQRRPLVGSFMACASGDDESSGSEEGVNLSCTCASKSSAFARPSSKKLELVRSLLPYDLSFLGMPGVRFPGMSFDDDRHSMSEEPTIAI